MATVPDLSGNASYALPSNVDVAFATNNRTNAGSPLGTLTPAFAGEIVRDTTTGRLWFARGLTSNDWIEYSIEA